MPGAVKTEGIVLRSIRYGEADRILHFYTPAHGRISAIAKGVRRAPSRFGGRLEPFFRLALVLYEGRSELLTVTSAETLAGHPRPRPDARRLRRGATAGRPGGRHHLGALSGAAGGGVGPGCQAGSFRLDEPAPEFLVTALARPLVEAPAADGRALAQAERAILETLEHHAHLQLRPVGARRG